MTDKDLALHPSDDRATHEPSPSVSAVPVGIPSAVAQAGTQMLRLSEVKGILFKFRHHALRNMRAAEEEDNWSWRERELTKVRFLNTFWNEITDTCAVFVNAQAIEARSGETREAGLDPKDESAVGSADASNPSGSLQDG